MKKQDTNKKKPIWLFFLIGLVAVAAAAVLLVAALGGFGGSQNTEPTSDATSYDSTKLYWNVEKNIYSSGEQIRAQRDGYYYVRFAVDGEQKDIKVADLLLVNYIDTMEVMGLVFDQDGIVVDALRVDETGSTIAAEDYYIESFTDDTLVCNSMGNRSGLSKSLPMSEATRVYMVDEGGSLLSGLPGTLKEKGRILAVADETGTLTHVYVVDPFQMGDVYWNTVRMYNSTTKLSTRQLDEQGRFAYTFAINGEQVTLYTRDQEIANAIDAVAAKCMGLEFDENGYITGVLATKKVTGGSSFASWCYVLGIDGNIVSAKKYSGSNIGSSYRGTLAEDCQVYDVSGKGAYIGEPTQLRLYDQVHGLKNEYGEICVLFIVSRTYEADIYYNVERQYDSAAKTTKRTPGADGYYRIKLAHNGQQVTLKTKDKDIVNSIDSTAVRCFGLQVEGDEILEFYTASMVWGGRQFCSYDFVTAIGSDGTVTAEEYDVENKGEQTYTGILTEDTNVYNVSSTASFIGEKTTLRVGDKIHALQDLNGKLTHIFVVGRSYNVPIYWNVDRQYDSANKTTKRTPNAEGYYEIVLAVNGQQKTYKTKSLELINQIDAVATKCFGLVTNGDIITKMYKTSDVSGGTQFCSWDYVTAIKGNTVVAKEADESKGNKTYTDFMTSRTKVYNVTGSGEFIGEETTLQVGDKIHALKYSDGGLNIIYVIERTEKVVEQTAYCQLCDKEVTWYSWDGNAAMEDGKHYYLAHNVGIASTAYIGADDNTDVEVTLDLRGYNITASVRAFRIYGTFNLLDTAEADGTIYGNATGQATGFYVYDAGIFNMYGGNFVGGSGANSQCGIGALGLKSGSKATFNMYGGSLQKGNTNKDGGNLSLYHSSVFNMYGGTIADGKTEANGGNIFMSGQCQVNIYGGTVTGGSALIGSCVYGSGTISLYNTAAIVIDDIYMSKALNVPEALAEGSKIGVTMPSGNGSVTGQTPEGNKAYFTATKGQITYENGKLVLQGQADKTAYCQHCGKEVQWYAWDGSFTMENGQHYFLKRAVSVSSTAYIGSADDNTVSVCLDLCGQNMDASVRAFRVYGNLNLMDSAETDGTITGNSNGQASVFYVYENAVFNMYGGKLTSAKTVTSDYGAGIGGIDKGTMNLYGGIITGGTAKRSGGNLNLYNTGTLNIYGGTIENGTSLENSGGNIQMSGSAKLNLYGGTVTGGKANNFGNDINGNGKITLYAGEKITVGEIYLPDGKKLTIDGTLIRDSSIGITLEEGTGVFAENTVEDNKSFFRAAQQITFLDGKLAVGEQTAEAARVAFCQHCGREAEWTVWDGASSMTTGHYYLEEAVSVTSTAYIGSAEDKTVSVCFDLCGNNIDATVRVFRVYGNLNLMDSAEADGTITGSTTGQASVFYVYENAVFNMYGGTMTNSKAVTSSAGTGIGGVDKGTMNMYGGTITDGKAQKSGGNLNLFNTGVLNMYGGTIANGTSVEASGGNIQMSSGSKLNLYGGTIAGGTAGNLGSCINGNGTITLYEKDKISVSQIRLPGGKTLTINGTLTEGSAIGILLADSTGVFTGETSQANKNCFTSASYTVVYEDGKLALSTSASTDDPEDPDTVLCRHCNQEVQWTAWDGSAVVSGTHYYLEDDLTLADTVYIGSTDNTDVTVCLDLRGSSITGSKRLFRVYGNLNLMDSAEKDGSLSSTATGQCQVFYVYQKGVLNMYGGNMTSTKKSTSTSGGGIGGVDSNSSGSERGVFNMYGGTISGGSSAGRGGNIVIFKYGTVNIYDGTVSSGSADTNGGNISLDANSTLNVYGGTITGGTAKTVGSDIYAAGSVTVSGTAKIGQIYLPENKLIAVDGVLKEGASVGIKLEAGTGTFTSAAADGSQAYFTPVDACTVKYENGVYALEAGHFHCICGGLGTIGDHTSCANVDWQPWPGVDQLVLDGSAYYYLTGEVSVDAAIKLTEGQTLNLCLNGQSITTTSNIYIFDISGTLNLCDHADAEGNCMGAVTNNYSGTGHSRVFYIRGSSAGSVFNLYGGNLSAPNAKATGTGGTVGRVGSTAGSAAFNMYAGKLFGGKASSSAVAGNLVLEQGCTMHMYGGEITGGVNDKGAGNIAIKNKAALYMHGGKITDGQGTNGGNVNVNANCTLDVQGGSITGGTATENGADVYAAGTVNVAAAAIVEKIYYPQ